MSVETLIERYNGAWNAQDLDTIHALHHPEIVFHNHTADERAEGADVVRAHIARIFENNPELRFSTRSLRFGEDFAVCEWTASVPGREWDGVDVFPIRDGLIFRKDVYSSSHRPRELPG
jgi:ketosteroid isomerase-like protein